MFLPITNQLPACRGVGPRALSNGINSAVFFVFFEALRAAFARHKEQVGHGCNTVGPQHNRRLPVPHCMGPAPGSCGTLPKSAGHREIQLQPVPNGRTQCRPLAVLHLLSFQLGPVPLLLACVCRNALQMPSRLLTQQLALRHSV